ncbi:peptidase M75 family protein [Nocardioides sp. BP30]|uniref:iron uptake system protein EfeO n=1 Tax=Nocardioides sp. BP30 TaxID=3036374 RepID=UPI002469B310|nr:iron uptake system protein EfeO [Nocardioides sp. BP30]WGL53624.1 peptidase M75 family protein [Nocardioides sp. BP30]
MSTASRRAAVSLVAAISLASLAACGSGNDDAADAGKGGGATTAAVKNGVSEVAITMASGSNGDVCTPSTTSVPAGPVTFSVKNESATGLTELELLQDQKIIGEKESLAPGLPASSFTLTLGGGTYQIYCPGAATETIDFKVTGQASATPSGSAATLLAQGAGDYGKYVTTQVDAMVASVRKLQQDVDAGDLTAAQKQYGEARPFYEKIESDVDGFVLPGFKPTDNKGNLDYLVDMRASNLDPAVGWHGFHAVERDLFGNRKITAKTKQLAAELTANLQKLATLSTTLTYKPEDLANGAAGLLEEVQANKISGEEEKYSHIDLVDFAANVEGAQQAFAYLKPGLTALDATLTSTIGQRFDTVNTMLDTYRDPAQIGGYKRYTAALKKSDANKLSQTVQALQDSLAHLAEKVATA